MLDPLTNESRLILKAKLRPITGSTFQPTGFPDLGAAQFQRPESDGSQTNALLVESVQSLANRLEELAWDSTNSTPIQPLSKLPYVEVRDPDGNFLTSSRLEPHRLAGAYIKTSKFPDEKQSVPEWMLSHLRLQKNLPTDWSSVYRGVLELDPMCLIHGVFFSDSFWGPYGNPRIRRAVTAVVEAHDVSPVISGGVKRDDVIFTSEKGRGSKEGFGFVPFGRTEFVAREIVLSAVIDLEQIRGYGLGKDGTDLLTLVALWEIRTFLDRPMRFRTACDLEVAELHLTRPSGWELPESEQLLEAIGALDLPWDNSEPHQVIYG